MTKRSQWVVWMALGMMVSVPQAFAGGEMLKACKKELKQNACDAKTEASIHECLEKHELHDKKDDGFSHACYEAHEAYEKAQGTQEPPAASGEAKKP